MVKSIKVVCDPSTSDPYPVYALRPATNTDARPAVWDGANAGKLKDGPAGMLTRGLNVIFDGGGAEIADDLFADVEFPVACTIKTARVLADQSGAIAIGVWKDTYANFPPTVDDSVDIFSIAASGTKSEETGLSLSVAAGSIIRFNVNSCTTIQRATLALSLEM